MKTNPLRSAVDLAISEKWDEAHQLVQAYDDEFACWIHAVLHRIEGDENNSRYWYRRAGKEFDANRSPMEELELIRASLSHIK